MSTKHPVADLVKINEIGWFAIKHVNGWWVGVEKGVTCYKEIDLARVALTLVHKRSGSTRLEYKIEIFTSEDIKNAGEFTPKYSAEEAFKMLKPRLRIRR